MASDQLTSLPSSHSRAARYLHAFLAGCTRELWQLYGHVGLPQLCYELVFLVDHDR
jgi:hypothetical protein